MLSLWRNVAFSLGIFAVTVFSGRAAETKVVPRHDPADQLFRRAPMAESARSIVVNLGTNLHAAFDPELGRVHTIWKGGPLNLWGPPYSNAKSPFICDFDGERVFRFPKFSPWRAGVEQLSAEFVGIKSVGDEVAFRYEVRGAKLRAIVDETITGTAEEERWTVKRRFAFPNGTTEELRYMVFAEGGIDRKLMALNKWAGTNGVVSFSVDGTVGEWVVFFEAVDYSSETITDAGTEKGNPMVRYSGEEARAYVTIPKRSMPFTFEITMGSDPGGIPIRKRESATVMRLAGQPERRRDSGDAFYKIEHFSPPPEAELMVTGMDWLNERDLAVCTWL
jgi:hypothetical protein